MSESKNTYGKRRIAQSPPWMALLAALLAHWPSTAGADDLGDYGAGMCAEIGIPADECSLTVPTSRAAAAGDGDKTATLLEHGRSVCANQGVPLEDCMALPTSHRTAEGAGPPPAPFLDVPDRLPVIATGSLPAPAAVTAVRPEPRPYLAPPSPPLRYVGTPPPDAVAYRYAPPPPPPPRYVGPPPPAASAYRYASPPSSSLRYAGPPPPVAPVYRDVPPPSPPYRYVGPPPPAALAYRYTAPPALAIETEVVTVRQPAERPLRAFREAPPIDRRTTTIVETERLETGRRVERSGRCLRAVRYSAPPSYRYVTC